MKEEETANGFWAGLGAGAILALIINLFIVWGGTPQGMYWRIDDNKKEIVASKKEIHLLKASGLFYTPYAITKALEKDVQRLNERVLELENENKELKERMLKEENRNWFGK